MEVVPRKHTRLHWAVAVLLLATAYGIAGRLSLLLAIPPGYASPLWPSAGLALAGLLIGGARVWPGIWLGSFLVNIGTVFDATHTTALLTSIAIPASIGVGATVQGLVGSALVRRFVGFPDALTRVTAIVAFLTLGGLASCLVSASVGVTTLALSGQIPWTMFAITWGTWWVGDTLGVLIVTPLVLSWCAVPRALWRRRRISVALPLVVTLSLAFVVFGYTRAQEGERLRLLFERQAESLAHTVQTRLDDYLDVLHAYASFYTTTPEVSRQAFHTFVQRFFVRHPGWQALSWDRSVPDAEREAYEHAVRREGFADFQITEQTTSGEMVRAAQRPEYVVVTYIEPYAENARALGFDVLSAPDRLDALQQARDMGQATATGQLTLVQGPNRPGGLLVFLPIYGQGLPSTTVEERRQGLRGYVTGVFQISDMIEAALHGLGRDGIGLRIEDAAALAGQRLLYDSRGRGLESRGPGRNGPEALGEEPFGGHWETTVELGGRRWRLHFAPTLGYLGARQSLQPWAVFGGGLAFTSLLGAFLLIVTGRAMTIEQLMLDRTAQLQASQQLEAAAQQRRREAEVLAELARTISATLDADAVLQRVAEGAQELCGSDGAAIALCEPGAQAAIIRYWAGIPYRGYHGVRIEPGRGIGGVVLATGRPYRTDDYAHDPRWSKEYLSITQAGRAVGVLVVPIHIGGRVEGLLYVSTRRPYTFTDHDEAILQRLADHAATALTNAQLYAEVQAGRVRLQALSRQLLEIQEAERRRIAHELHDEAGQLLVSVHLALETAVSRLPLRLREYFQPVRGHLDAIETQLRRLSHELRPAILDHLGLLPALQFFVDGVAGRTGLRCCLESSLAGRLTPPIETVLYRIMQEGITNIIKHAAATHVQLRLWRDARMVYGLLQDNGAGFAVDQVMGQTGPQGLGLLGIQERLEALGGTFQITSSPGHGTTLCITLPVEPWEVYSEAACPAADPGPPPAPGRG